MQNAKAQTLPMSIPTAQPATFPKKPQSTPSIAKAVEITGSLGGIALTAIDQPLVIDCSLAVSLDEAGRYLAALGVDKATFSSAYSRRNVRGTSRPSKHSFGLAIDVHTFSGPALGSIRVDRDYEQGLGDDVDCVGAPITQGGAILKVNAAMIAEAAGLAPPASNWPGFADGFE